VADQSETASVPWSDVYAVDDPEFSPGPHRTRAVLHNGYLDVPVTFRSACVALLEMFAVPQRSLRTAHTGQRTQPRRSIRKAGTVVVVGAGPNVVSDVQINLVELTMYQKTIAGALFGGASGFTSVPRLIELYINGRLKLDEMVTKTYKLDDIGQGFPDMLDGTIIRGVIDF
jgi:threonine dehydrogenase-like Zn-dependent dehydrogenase